MIPTKRSNTYGFAGTIAHDIKYPDRSHDEGEANDEHWAWQLATEGVRLEDDRDGYLVRAKQEAEALLRENWYLVDKVAAAAKTNDFVADERGNAQLTVVAPQSLTHDNAVLLVYHSDKTAHGEQRGDIGINAYHQLIARIPW